MDEDPILTAAISPTRGVTIQDQNIVSSLESSSSRRQAKSAPTTPKKARRTAAPQIPIENVPDLKLGLERLKLKKMPDAKTQRSLRTVTSASAISSIRGQQFTVGNFSNGLIYLRPVIRPAHEKLIPLRPSEERAGYSWRDEASPREPELRSREKPHPPTSPPRTPTRRAHKQEGADFYIKSSPPVPTRSHHHRAYSFSTATGRSTPTAQDLDGYRVVIDRVETQRPKTAGPEPLSDGLHVNIPHYMLGSPCFTPHGIPFLQGSLSNQGSSSLIIPSTKGELGSSTGSPITDFKWFMPGDERLKLSSSPIPLLPGRENSPFASPPPSMPSPIRHIPTSTAITPQIFDVLSFPPFSELPSIVKYDPRNQQILAATPPRIIAQITSATFLDYQLLSDFFLTFRLFMTPLDLVAYLVARLRWAIARNDDIGRVVRVRAFVAIRHWLLNYFGDDFVPSLTLRQKFVSSLNDLAETVLLGGSQSDIKIIGELKKCWRRTCALYWEDGGSTGADATIEQEILPGRAPGESNQSDKIVLGFPLQSSSVTRPGANLSQVHQKAVNNGKFNSLGDIETKESSPKFSDDLQAVNKKLPMRSLEKKVLTKAASDASLNATSKVSKKSTSHAYLLPGFTGTKSSLKAAPSSNDQTFASVKKSRPSAHKRSGSFSDALRDNRQPLPLQNSLARSTHVLMAFPYAGSSLVRGTLLPPTAAYVEVIAPSTPTPEDGLYISNTMSMASSSTGISEQYEPASHHHRVGLGGPGMKKFIESLKKALSGIGHPSMYNASVIHSPVPVSKHGSTSNNSDFTTDSLTRYVAANYIRNSGSSGSRSGRGWTGSMDGKMARIDLLGAGVVDAFQRVIQEEIIPGEKTGDQRGTERQRSTRSKQILRRATVDTTTVGESVLSEFDERSVIVENFPLSPQTRRRGNTIRGPSSSNAANMVKELQGGMRAAQVKSLANSNIEDFGLIGLGTSSRAQPEPSTSKLPLLQETPEAQKQAGYFGDKVLRRVSADLSLSATGEPKSKGQSYQSYTSHIDGYSDAASIFGTLEDVAQALPNRLLRRKPGGDLRAAANITDLGVPTRPKSTGSLSTFSKSTSVYSFNAPPSVLTFGNSRDDYGPRPQQLAARVVSLGAVAKGGGVQFPISDDTMQPPPASPTTAKELFEQGVMQLAALADNESDDGGIEVALMKLEGRYDRRMSKSLQAESRPSSEVTQQGNDLSGTYNVINDRPRSSAAKHRQSIPSTFTGLESHHGIDLKDVEPYDDYLTRFKRRHKKVVDQVPLETPPAFNSSASSFGFPFAEVSEKMKSTEIAQPSFPWNSIPRAAPLDLPISPKQTRFQDFRSEQMSTQHTTEEDDDYMSELSSELSFDLQSRSQSLNNASHHKFPKSSVIADLGISSHPLRHPPSPSLTFEQALGMNPDAPNGFYQPYPSTSDQDAFPWASIHNMSSPDSTPRQRKKPRDSISLLQPPSIHLPFILAYDSELLAKQFTLIEKDALNEIDWKELVELRWKQTSTMVRDWVEFLKLQNVHGVELIIARFNLMWKWAMSEIVMTRDIDERARTIVKMIHIAAHARKLQNFATMYQITAALLNSNIARLRKTWKLVSPPDVETFKQLEALIQPVRNFHNLRIEMDKVTGETGCIPFVGLFTHDLIYNAQRPSHLVGTSDGGLLVNFEKHRMTATIIKRLLRLTEASHKYDFKAVDGVCERCLWIASLSDEEIKGLSKNLEA